MVRPYTLPMQFFWRNSMGNSKLLKIGYDELKNIDTDLNQSKIYTENPNIIIDDCFDDYTTLTSNLNAHTACVEEEELRNLILGAVNNVCTDLNTYGVTFEELEIFQANEVIGKMGDGETDLIYMGEVKQTTYPVDIEITKDESKK